MHSSLRRQEAWWLLHGGGLSAASYAHALAVGSHADDHLCIPESRIAELINGVTSVSLHLQKI